MTRTADLHALFDIRPGSVPAHLVYAPNSEVELVFLLGRLADAGTFDYSDEWLVFDCWLRPVGAEHDRALKIEIETRSSHFRRHGHQPEHCDGVVCWKDDAGDLGLPVLALEYLFPDLRPRPSGMPLRGPHPDGPGGARPEALFRVAPGAVRAHLTHAPFTEKAIALLLGRLASAGTFDIVSLETRFPDLRVRGRGVPPQPEYDIELELSSTGYRRHRGSSIRCDAVVCWTHDDPALDLPVIALDEVFPSLSSAEAPPHDRYLDSETREMLQSLEEFLVKIDISPRPLGSTRQTYKTFGPAGRAAVTLQGSHRTELQIYLWKVFLVERGEKDVWGRLAGWAARHGLLVGATAKGRASLEEGKNKYIIRLYPGDAHRVDPVKEILRELVQ